MFFFSPKSASILHLGLLAVSEANLFSFTTNILHLKFTKHVQPQTAILFTVAQACLNLSLGVVLPVRRPRSGSRTDAPTPLAPPGEKMSGITALSTAPTPKTDGASGEKKKKLQRSSSRNHGNSMYAATGSLPGQSGRRMHRHLSRSPEVDSERTNGLEVAAERTNARAGWRGIQWRTPHMLEV